MLIPSFTLVMDPDLNEVATPGPGFTTKVLSGFGKTRREQVHGGERRLRPPTKQMAQSAWLVFRSTPDIFFSLWALRDPEKWVQS